MSTITAILEADADGTLHLPLPAGLRRGKIKVEATIRPAAESEVRSTREEAQAALRRLRDLGTFKDIRDPVAWQREMREDVNLPPAMHRRETYPGYFTQGAKK